MKTIWPFLTAGLPFWELRQLFPWDLTRGCTWGGYRFSQPQNYLLGFTRAEQLQSTEVMPYEVWHCNLKLGIVHSQMEPIAAVWHSLAGCLGLTGGPWGHWVAAVANAAALPSCILTCCPQQLFWLTVQRKLISILWHSKKRYFQVQWESSEAASMGCSALLCTPWLQHSPVTWAHGYQCLGWSSGLEPKVSSIN